MFSFIIWKEYLAHAAKTENGPYCTSKELAAVLENKWDTEHMKSGALGVSGWPDFNHS